MIAIWMWFFRSRKKKMPNDVWMWWSLQYVKYQIKATPALLHRCPTATLKGLPSQEWAAGHFHPKRSRKPRPVCCFRRGWKNSTCFWLHRCWEEGKRGRWLLSSRSTAWPGSPWLARCPRQWYRGWSWPRWGEGSICHRAWNLIQISRSNTPCDRGWAGWQQNVLNLWRCLSF